MIRLRNATEVKKPDFERAKQYALNKLGVEIDTLLAYHGVSHTRDDVVPAAERLAEMAGLDDEETLLLLTAAWFHDLGNIVQRDGHEEISVRMAKDVLPEMGYSDEQIEIIAGIIMATKLPQSPTTLVEMLMADADLDMLGRDDFWPNSQFLYLEMDALGETMSEEEWYLLQLEFLREHQYFTDEARALRDEGKKHNIQLITTALAQLIANES